MSNSKQPTTSTSLLLLKNDDSFNTKSDLSSPTSSNHDNNQSSNNTTTYHSQDDQSLLRPSTSTLATSTPHRHYHHPNSNDNNEYDDDDDDQVFSSTNNIKFNNDGDEPDALPSSLRFNWFDILCIVISMCTYLFDLGMDLFIAYIYYSVQAIHYFILTLIFVIIPAVTMTAFSLRWYIMDMDNLSIDPPSVTKWILRIIFLLLQLAPVLRYIDSLNYGLKSRRAKAAGSKAAQLKYYTNMVNEDADATLLRLFEAFMEAAPQVTLQLYIFIVHSYSTEPGASTAGEGQHHSHGPGLGLSMSGGDGGPFGGRNTKIQLLAIVSSLISLAWSLSSYHRSLRYAQPDKSNITYQGTILQFLWHFCGISCRILALGLFASCFPILVIPIVGLHLLGMVSWLILQENTSLVDQHCEEVLLSLVIGFIYIFTFFNVRDEPTRYKYTAYYSICFIENVLFMAAWYYSAGGGVCPPSSADVGGDWIRPVLLGAHFSLFGAGLIAMVCYYVRFHPSKSISISWWRRSSKTRSKCGGDLEEGQGQGHGTGGGGTGGGAGGPMMIEFRPSTTTRSRGEFLGRRKSSLDQTALATMINNTNSNNTTKPFHPGHKKNKSVSTLPVVPSTNNSNAPVIGSDGLGGIIYYKKARSNSAGDAMFGIQKATAGISFGKVRGSGQQVDKDKDKETTRI